jgi:DNA-binding response OmpR family regulator
LEQNNFELHLVNDAESALAALSADPSIDLVMLVSGCCLRVPGNLLGLLRARTEAGILLAAECPDSGACALEQGADDWVSIMVNPRELTARLRNLAGKMDLIRSRPRSDTEALYFSGWRLDCDRRELIRPDGAQIRLTGAEAALLFTLATNAGRSLDREWLLDRISNRRLAPTSRSIDVTIAQLRRKLGDDPRRPRFIVTMHGIGYRFTADPGWGDRG